MKISESFEQQLFMITGGVVLLLVLGVVVFNVLQKSDEDNLVVEGVAPRPEAKLDAPAQVGGGESSWIDRVKGLVFRPEVKLDAPVQTTGGGKSSWIDSVVPAPVFGSSVGSPPPPTAVAATIGNQGDLPGEGSLLEEPSAVHAETTPSPRPVESERSVKSLSSWSPNAGALESTRQLLLNEETHSTGKDHSEEGHAIGGRVGEDHSEGGRFSGDVGGARPADDALRGVGDSAVKLPSREDPKGEVASIVVGGGVPPIVAAEDVLPIATVKEVPVVKAVSPFPVLKLSASLNSSPVSSGLAFSQNAGAAFAQPKSVAVPVVLPKDDIETTKRIRAVPLDPVPTARAQAGTRIGYWVRLGSFSNENNAMGLVQHLYGTIFEGKSMPVSRSDMTVGDKRYYRVQVGPFADRAQADRAAQLVQKEVNLTGTIISHRE